MIVVAASYKKTAIPNSYFTFIVSVTVFVAALYSLFPAAVMFTFTQ